MPTINFQLRQTGQKVQDDLDLVESGIAPLYSELLTYDVGDFVVYSGKLYKCNTAVTIIGQFDSSKWTQVKLVDELGGSGGGSDHLYQHTIRLEKDTYDNEANINIAFTFFSSSSTPITNWSGLVAALPQLTMASGYINDTTYTIQVTDIMVLYGQVYVYGRKPYTSAALNDIYENTSMGIDSLGPSCNILDKVTQII